MKRVRCAIYTRKSSEEGLEQDFNSLHAQREACEAYILSQASEGWTLIPAAYDDGGLSGGTLERPGLQQLLADIAARKIDIVVVYKVDRLTRSLLDFAKLVEAFDTSGTSFVSVTQSFNTTTSMGRLTLNMLLSFAQFEREVTAERIRDKLAASKRKGMWMGGVPPLGYRPDGRTLAIVEDHAALIRDIFVCYLTRGNVRLVAQDLINDGIMVPVRQMIASGRNFGGVPFTRGQIYRILSNPIYIGEIVHHRRASHAEGTAAQEADRWLGLHPAIVDRMTWEKVQAKLAANGHEHRNRVHAKDASLLAGLLFDGHGEPLVATHANKKGRRYRYYVSCVLQHGGDARNSDGIRLPASEIEPLVINRLAGIVADPLRLAERVGIAILPDQCANLLRTGQKFAEHSRNRPDPALIRMIVARILIEPEQITITLERDGLIAAMGLNPAAVKSTAAESIPMTETIPARLKRSGLAMRLILPGDMPANAREPDPALVKAIVRANDWWKQLRADPTLTIEALAKQEGVTASYITRIIRLALLAPAIVETIVAGKQPSTVDVKSLTASPLPICWDTQRAALGL